MSELKHLFDDMIKELEKAVKAVEEGIGYYRDVADKAKAVLKACKDRGIESNPLVIDLASEEEWMCAWATIFHHIGSKLNKTNVLCLMYLASMTYFRLRDAFKQIQELLNEIKGQEEV